MQVKEFKLCCYKIINLFIIRDVLKSNQPVVVVPKVVVVVVVLVVVVVVVVVGVVVVIAEKQRFFNIIFCITYSGLLMR